MQLKELKARPFASFLAAFQGVFSWQEASGAYQRRSKELEHQLRETTKHFEAF